METSMLLSVIIMLSLLILFLLVMIFAMNREIKISNELFDKSVEQSLTLIEMNRQLLDERESLILEYSKLVKYLDEIDSKLS